MTDPKHRKGPPTHQPEGQPNPKTPREKEEREKRKNPVFRFARLDGRDSLKYEDTADK